SQIKRLSHWRFDGGNGGLDAIVNKRIAAYLLAIAKNGDGPLLQQGFDEAMISHVGPLSRPVNREITQNDQRQTKFLVGSAQILGSQLGHAIRGDRPQGGAFVADAVTPIDGGCRSVDESLYRRCFSNRFQQPMRS